MNTTEDSCASITVGTTSEGHTPIRLHVGLSHEMQNAPPKIAPAILYNKDQGTRAAYKQW